MRKKLTIADRLKQSRLPLQYQKRILDYIDNPSYKGWESIYPIVINSNGLPSTIWQAVNHNDATFQSSAAENKKVTERWFRIPTAMEIEKILKEFLEKAKPFKG